MQKIDDGLEILTGRFHVDCGIITISNNSASEPVITSANDEFYRIVNYTRDELASLFQNNLFNLVAPADKEDIFICIHRQLEDSHEFSVKFDVVSKDHHPRSLLMSGYVLKNGETRASIFRESISERVDELTGLPSLLKFQSDVKALLESGSSCNNLMLSFDFEKFKNANERFGYSTGNRILIAFSNVLRDILHEGEIACRYYADRFLAFLHYKSEDELKKRFSELDDSLRLLQAKNSGHFNFPVTIGAYYIPKGEKDVISIIDKANIARKTAKGSHKNAFAAYNGEIRTRFNHETDIEIRMASALHNHEFLVYLQPKINLTTNEIVGAEALVRWESADGKITQPNDFIPLFEKNGFIISLDFYVYEAVFNLLAEWKKEGKRLVPISVNVSPLHFKSDDFPTRFNNLVDKYCIDHGLIEIELTESLFLQDVQRVSSIMRELKDYGYLISIDDFGSGYSSLNVLKELPADILKLDKEFFKNESVGKREKTIVSYVIHMAKELDLTVLSEGVETTQQEEFLRDNHCDLAQGFLFAKPMPIEEFEKLICKE